VVRSNENGILSRNWKHINRQGEEMIMHIVSHRIQYNGRPAMMSLSIDITEQVRLKEKLKAERKARQKEITSAVITAQENERRNIGIELHDNINQVLASARLYLDLAKEKNDKQELLINETGSLINRAIDEIRALSHSLVPPSLEDISLSGALREMTHILSVATGLRIVRNIEEIEEDAISYQLRLAIYRVVQEQLNNIIRHARAHTVWIHLQKKDSFLYLTVKDDGRGFDPAKRSGGVGLMNMKTRVSLFSGSFQISSSPGNGCVLSVSFNAEV
jgi:signal transduction histidine kinase